MVTLRPEEAGLNKLLDIVLDKGVTVDSKAKIRLTDINLLGTKSHIVLSSFETAKKIGLKFPKNTNLNTQAWQELLAKQTCPVCGMNSTQKELRESCPWCGWICKQGDK
jgi:ssDNA-binding Zn-finger/Zn-ribbon topoisomerase 1